MQVVLDGWVGRLGDIALVELRAGFLFAALEAGAEILEEHRHAVERTVPFRSVGVGIGDDVGEDLENGLELRVQPGDRGLRLRRQLRRGDRLALHQPGERDRIVLAPFRPAHR